MKTLTMTLKCADIATCFPNLERAAVGKGGTLDICGDDGGTTDLVISAPTEEALLQISRVVADELIRKAIAGPAR